MRPAVITEPLPRPATADLRDHEPAHDRRRTCCAAYGQRKHGGRGHRPPPRRRRWPPRGWIAASTPAPGRAQLGGLPDPPTYPGVDCRIHLTGARRRRGSIRESTSPPTATPPAQPPLFAGTSPPDSLPRRQRKHKVATSPNLVADRRLLAPCAAGDCRLRPGHRRTRGRALSQVCEALSARPA